MQDLNEIVRENEERDWTEVWQEFYRDEWFRERLDQLAGFVLRKTKLPRGWKDDVKQEALIFFARALNRNATLGFDHSRGNIKPFVSTVIFRCCQHGVRKFKKSMRSSVLNETMQPFYDTTDDLDDHLDLHEMLFQIPDPYRQTAQEVLRGKSIERIADEFDLSPRTVYRYLDRATILLREKMDIDHKV